MVALFPEGSGGGVRQSASGNDSVGHDSGVVHQYLEVVEMLESALESARIGKLERLKRTLFSTLAVLLD